MRLQQLGIQRKISQQNFGVDGPEQSWESSDAAKKLKEQSEAIKLQHRLVRKQSQRLGLSFDDPDYIEGQKGNAFVRLYMTSSKGLGLKVPGTDRDSTVQSNFRQALIKHYDAAHPDPKMETLWCPITRRWVSYTDMTAAHVFGFCSGEEMMYSIFGREAAESELSSPLNGILMSTKADQLFDKGRYVKVPALDENATPEENREWHDDPSKPYKIRVVESNTDDMTKYIDDNKKTWAELDDELVEFRTSFRPRARYLYFHYVCSMLRRAWKTPKKETVLVDQLGKKFWGTPGPYMRRAMLKAFVTEVGHEFEDILEGAQSDEDEEEQDDTALAVAAEQIAFSNQKDKGVENDSDTESDGG